MRLSVVRLSFATFLTVASPAGAENMTLDDYWREARAAHGHVTECQGMTIIKADLAVYIFTKPGNPAHPGVIVRRITTQDIETEGRSFGSDSDQPAFKAWMDNPFREPCHP